MSKQFLLFEEAEEVTKKKTRNEIFTDYESFLKKFDEKEKTTDDCYTPDDVFQAILQWLSRTVCLVGKKIIRPFYPGGDYLACEYPEDGIVVDNPPFSILSKIVRFYAENEIPFFLFAPALQSLRYSNYATSIFIDWSMTFENGASINTNFISNIVGPYAAMTSPELRALIAACPSQKRIGKKKVVYPPKYYGQANLTVWLHVALLSKLSATNVF